MARRRSAYGSPRRARRRAGCRPRSSRSSRSRRPASPRPGSPRPATIVGARSGCRPATSRRSASGSAARWARISSTPVPVQPVAVHALGVVGLQLLVDRRELTWPCPATAMPGRRRARTSRGTSASMIAARPRRATPIAARRVGGSSVRWRSVWRTEPPASTRGSRVRARRADHELGASAADVDHQQRVAARRAVAGRAEERQPRLLVAARSCASRRRSARRAPCGTPRRSPRRGPRSWPPRQPCRRRACRSARGTTRAVANTRSIAVAAEPARRVDALAKASHLSAPLELLDPAVAYVRHEQPRRVRPEVDDGDAPTICH